MRHSPEYESTSATDGALGILTEQAEFCMESRSFARYFPGPKVGMRHGNPRQSTNEPFFLMRRRGLDACRPSSIDSRMYSVSADGTLYASSNDLIFFEPKTTKSISHGSHAQGHMYDR